MKSEYSGFFFCFNFQDFMPYKYLQVSLNLLLNTSHHVHGTLPTVSVVVEFLGAFRIRIV